MFYDFYCNEKMLLDNYKKNDLGNRALKRVIGRSGMTPDKCADMYLTMFDNSLNLNYDRYDLVRHFETCGTKTCELLQIDSIKVYKQDIEWIMTQIETHNLKQKEQLCLFGVVMMCRILHMDTIDLTTEFKIKRFCGCFESHLHDVTIRKGKWYETYHAPIGMETVSDEYGILLRTDSEHTAKKVGCYYTYENYDLKNNEVVYEMVVTPDTNRLNLYALYQTVGLKNIRFCVRCGCAFTARGNMTKYCDDCAKIIKREQTRERVRKYRQRHSTM